MEKIEIKKCETSFMTKSDFLEQKKFPVVFSFILSMEHIFPYLQNKFYLLI